MKIKLVKIIFALSIFSFVFSTIGISVIEHYCGGELEEVAVFSKPDSCCIGDDESQMMDDGCCKNKISHIVFHKDFTFKILTKKIDETFDDLLINNIKVFAFLFNSNYVNVVINNSIPKPPPPELIQHFIIECSVIKI